MGIALRLVRQSSETNRVGGEFDYSIAPLRQLLLARHGLDGDGHSDSGRRLDEEIHRRCAQEPSRRMKFAGSGNRYRLYGLMAGIFSLTLSSGPFLAVEFLDAMSIVADGNGDHALLSGAWALLTLPFAVLIFMIGAIMDAERVVQWFKL
jgi:hypothetical protein